jgi:hypothetical protein
VRVVGAATCGAALLVAGAWRWMRWPCRIGRRTGSGAGLASDGAGGGPAARSRGGRITAPPASRSGS